MTRTKSPTRITPTESIMGKALAAGMALAYWREAEAKSAARSPIWEAMAERKAKACRKEIDKQITAAYERGIADATERRAA